MDVITWLDSLHSTTADGAVTNQKWPEAQAAMPIVEQMSEAKRRLDGLRALAGYVEDGSCQAVTICQDDATRDWVVSLDRQYYAYGRSFEQAIDAAITQFNASEI